jgi:AraC-like DNA-binding protein
MGKRVPIHHATVRTSPSASRDQTAADSFDLQHLVRMLAAHAPYDGTFELRIPGVYASRASAVQKAHFHAVQGPGLCLVAQGAKRVFLGTEVFDYDAARMLVYSLDIPVSALVTRASLEEPYYGIRIGLEPARIAELAAKVYPQGLPDRNQGRAVCVGQADQHVLNAVARLVGLASQPDDVELIAPLVMDELLIRLLKSPLGPRVALIGQEESKIGRIAKAISWIRGNFDQPLDVERLAGKMNMSTSSFHQHFKEVTSLSPLQYQKTLRLQEARRLMLLNQLDAGMAGRRVGYLSASQFAREYSRQFGNPPSKDIAQLRQQAALASPA